MARFDYYRNRAGRGYLVDLQSDLVGSLNTRVVAPLMPLAEAPRPASRLNPVFEIGNRKFVMVTQFMAAVPLVGLQDRSGSLSQEHAAIVDAIDMIFSGF